MLVEHTYPLAELRAAAFEGLPDDLNPVKVELARIEALRIAEAERQADHAERTLARLREAPKEPRKGNPRKGTQLSPAARAAIRNGIAAAKLARANRTANHIRCEACDDYHLAAIATCPYTGRATQKGR